MRRNLGIVLAAAGLAAVFAASSAAQIPGLSADALRWRAGWADGGDAGNGLGLGLDYRATDNIMGSVNWFNLDLAELWELQGTYLVRSHTTPDVYYGLGLGFYRGNGDTPPEGQEGTATFDGGGGSLGLHGAVGIEDPKGRFFAEARYVIGTLGGGNVNGLRLFVGSHF